MNGLEFLKRVPVGAHRNFHPSDKFRVMRGKTGPFIAHVTPTFQQLIFEAGITEPQVKAAHVRICQITREPDHAQLRRHLAFAKTGVALAHIFELLEKQPCGDEGPLLTDGWPNCCPVINVNRQVCVVMLRWYRRGRVGDKDFTHAGYPFDGWRISAVPFSSPDWGCRGHRIAYY